MSPGTILLTGANGSLGLPVVRQLLQNHSAGRNFIFTVRNVSSEDKYTEKLRAIIAQAKNNPSVSIRALDLSSLAVVHAFAKYIHSKIASGAIPRLEAVIWNAMSWSIHGGIQYTTDGFEKSIAVNHLSHLTMTLRLLDSFMPDGRIVFLGSDSHKDPGFGKMDPELPGDLEELVHPPPDKEGEVIGKGFQRYGVSKLVVIMVMYELARRVKQDEKLKGLAVLATDPGGLMDSRAMYGPDIPPSWSRQVTLGNWLLPVLKLFFKPPFGRSEDAAGILVDFAVGEERSGADGYYEMGKKVESSKASLDVEMQRKLWDKSVEWCGISQEDTVLRL